jgi:hypothetical protein
MNLTELEEHVSIMLNQLRVKYRKLSLMKGVSSQLIVDDFGLIICCINRVDYAQVNEAVSDQFKGWRAVFVTTNDNLSIKKNEVLWSLMRGGYMKWLRYTFPRQIKNVLNGPDDLGRKIIEERLRIWGEKPKYKFLVEDNREAFRSGILRELTNDPSFFDYMPEEE